MYGNYDNRCIFRNGSHDSAAVEGIVLTLARIPLAMILSATALGLNGIWWSISISSILKGVVLVTWFIVYFKKVERKRKLEKSACILK